MMLPFLSINIETTDGCNRKCPWCPNAKIDKPPEFMGPQLYAGILDQLRGHDYTGRVHLYQRGEPLTDERLAEWTGQAREKLPKCHLYISTNGDFLTRKKAHELIRAGMNEIEVSHYDGMREDLVRETSHLHGIVFHYDKRRDDPSGHWFNRAGLVNVAPAMKMANNCCWWIFRKMCIACNGDMQLCCADWFPCDLHNAYDMTLEELWNQPKMLEYRKAHLAGKGKEMPKCKDCNLLT